MPSFQQNFPFTAIFQYLRFSCYTWLIKRILIRFSWWWLSLYPWGNLVFCCYKIQKTIQNTNGLFKQGTFFVITVWKVHIDIDTALKKKDAAKRRCEIICCIAEIHWKVKDLVCYFLVKFILCSIFPSFLSTFLL